MMLEHTPVDGLLGQPGSGVRLDDHGSVELPPVMLSIEARNASSVVAQQRRQGNRAFAQQDTPGYLADLHQQWRVVLVEHEDVHYA